MSAANSAAKKRRAPPSIEPPRVGGGGAGGPGMGGPGMGGPGGPGAPTTGLTLPQVIALIDKRLVNLETITKDKMLSEGSSGSSGSSGEDGEEGSGGVDPAVLDEFNARFEIMAEEIANIKSIVLSLQSYTMDVNKILMEERAAAAAATAAATAAAAAAAATVAPVVEAPGVTLEPQGVNNDPLEEVVPQTPKWKKMK